jgi:hypothetical protein
VDGWTNQFYNIWFTNNKSETIQYYNKMCPNEPIRVLVDDLVDNLKNLPLDVVGVVWEQPWNSGYYPRARYNEENWHIEFLDSVSENWKPLWESEHAR